MLNIFNSCLYLFNSVEAFKKESEAVCFSLTLFIYFPMNMDCKSVFSTLLCFLFSVKLRQIPPSFFNWTQKYRRGIHVYLKSPCILKRTSH